MNDKAGVKRVLLLLGTVLLGLGLGCSQHRELSQTSFSYSRTQLADAAEAAHKLRVRPLGGETYKETSNLLSAAKGFCAGTGCMSLTIEGSAEDRPNGKVLVQVIFIAFDESGKELRSDDSLAEGLEIPIPALVQVDQLVRSEDPKK